MAMDKDAIRFRIELMRKRWGVFAATREGFALTLLTLLEVDGRNGRDKILTIGSPGGPSGEHLLERLDENYAEKACDAALAVLDTPKGDVPAPQGCNVKLSCYSTCPVGTKGCISKHHI